jgi:hypothetical protein
MPALCPLCGQVHPGIERVQVALVLMLEQVHAWERAQQVPALLRPKPNAAAASPARSAAGTA